MQLIFAILALTHAAPASPGIPPELTARIELISLAGVKGPLAIRLDSLRREISIAADDRAGLLRRLRAAHRTICPSIELRNWDVVLRCRTPKLRVELKEQGPGRALELRELLVPPWRGGDAVPPLPGFDPAALGLGGPCPGTTPAGRGECALGQGQLEEARREFQAALDGPAAALASLRLGDLALLADDPVGAVAAWKRAMGADPYSHLAIARLCELEPQCFDSPRAPFVFRVADVPERVRVDMALRAARFRAYSGELSEVAAELSSELSPAGACAGSLHFCRAVLLAAMKEPGAPGERAFRTYLDLPLRDRGPLAVELAQTAADRAESSGAPVFAANLLALMVGRVPADGVPRHLLRTAQLYLEGGDWVRAGVVIDFTRTHLGGRAVASADWAAVRRELAARPGRVQAQHPQRLGRLEDDLKEAEKALASASGVGSAEGGSQ